MIYQIGCGGSGSWLAQFYPRAVKEIVFVDGDTVEPKNLDRQFFREEHIGMKKAAVVAVLQSHTCHSIQNYLVTGTEFETKPGDIVMGCVDNHHARRLIFNNVDNAKGVLYIDIGNQEAEASGWVYKREWKGTPLDPRIRHPEIETDQSGRPDDPCTADQESRQTKMANIMAATIGLRMLAAWQDYKLPAKYKPVEIWTNASSQTLMTYEQMKGAR